MEREQLAVEIMGCGFAWSDTGTHDSLLEAAKYVEILERRQGLKISCPEEVAYYKGFIDRDRLVENARQYGKSGYADYLPGSLARIAEPGHLNRAAAAHLGPLPMERHTPRLTWQRAYPIRQISNAGE
ncbi:MAG TPA: hypothetical protein VLZ74_00610 [Methylocella sp.]|nr:hypothetical protein [Methylocella sp.]